MKPEKKPHDHDLPPRSHANVALIKKDARKWIQDLDGWIKEGLPKREALTLEEATRRRALLRALVQLAQ